MKTFMIVLFTVVILVGSCHSNQENRGHTEEHEGHGQEGIVSLTALQREALELRTGTFQMRNLTTVVKTNGQLEVPPANRAEVTAVIGGNVRNIYVFHGDRVKKGQLLATLEHPDYIALQEEFAETASRLEFLELEYQRQQQLYENNVGAGRDFQEVKAEYNGARVRYEGLKSRLELLNLSPEQVLKGTISNTLSIYSPIDGYVNEIPIKVGTYADDRDILFEITDNSKIHADFMVYEKDVHLLREGQQIHFTVSNRPGEELPATIFAIGKEFEANTRAVHIHATLDQHPGDLIPGMYISGHIHTDESYTRTLPNDAVVTEGTRSYIFVAESQEPEHDHEAAPGNSPEQIPAGESAHTASFKQVEVITGKQDEGYTEIRLLDPLPEDTRVVLNAAYYLLAEMKKEETEHVH